MFKRIPENLLLVIIRVSSILYQCKIRYFARFFSTAGMAYIIKKPLLHQEEK
jgi:hypothetical protein